MFFQGLLLGLGLQHRTIEDLEKELDLPASQLLGLFNRIIRKIVQVCKFIIKIFQWTIQLILPMVQ